MKSITFDMGSSKDMGRFAALIASLQSHMAGYTVDREGDLVTITFK